MEMIDISIIIPIYNGEKWITNCMNSIARQSAFKTNLKIEIVVFNDGSKDATAECLEQWAEFFRKQSLPFIVTGKTVSRGVGAAKNGAVEKSSGQFLCFQDIDDVMHPDRILSQWEIAKTNRNTLIGSRIKRIPEDSTPRFVKWANNLSTIQLKTQIYTSNGPTLLMPTWFCHRSVFNKVGGFDETGLGVPEDLIFFYAHLDAGGDLYRVDKELLVYTYHENAATFSVNRQNIWEIQLKRLQDKVLPQWDYFTVWNAGKAGRRFVRGLDSVNARKVKAFCDVDKKKIGRTIELYSSKTRTVNIKLPVLHYSDIKPPIVICMKLDLTNGDFENNLQSMNLTEGDDYIIFN